MNIFKTLATGDGRLDEPNVSAFLAYLLDPNEDHGLNDELLKKIIRALHLENLNSPLLEFINDKEGNIRNFSSRSNFEFVVLLEQAFKLNNEDRKRILDLVIICFEKKVNSGQSLAKEVLSDNYSRGELKHIFLIENKINKGSIDVTQLPEQRQFSIDTLSIHLNKSPEEILRLISLIYIIPDCSEGKAAFDKFRQEHSDILTSRLLWTSEDKDVYTIADMLKEILKKDSEGEIEAINEYPKYTMKSFLAFIENDFKSAIQEKLTGKNEKHEFDSLDKLRESQPTLLNSISWETAEAFDSFLKKSYSDLSCKYSYHHPIAVFKNQSVKHGTKIFGFSIKANKNLVVDIILKNFENLRSQRNTIKSEIKNIGFEVKELGEHDLRISTQEMNFQKVQQLFEIIDQSHKISSI